MSDSRLMKPSDPRLQAALWNDYYHGCVAKGGVFLQPCGWEGTFDLWAGAVSDSQYLVGEKVLERQKLFAEADPTCDSPFVNILDKGYRVTVDAFKEGKQLCWQPYFAPSDRRYNTNEVLHSAAVAATRSGNERSVRHVKLSWMCKLGGGLQGWEFEYLADVWLAWGFQINFMYTPSV